VQYIARDDRELPGAGLGMVAAIFGACYGIGEDTIDEGNKRRAGQAWILLLDNVRLKTPKLRRQAFEAAIIEPAPCGGEPRALA
jgi:hypothetical protein